MSAQPILRFSYIGKALFVALAYFACAWLSLHVAIPPGNASAIWPAAALAICALAKWGRGMAIAVFAGAALANLNTGLSLLSAAAIGLGNTLEALAAACLIQRLLGRPPNFSNAESAFKFVAIAVASPLIAASVGAFVLLVQSRNPQFDFAENWLTWWLGDMNGIIIFAPMIILMMTDHPRSERSWAGPRLPKFLAACILIALFTHIVFAAWNMPAMVLAFVIWAAYQFGLSGVSVLPPLVAAIVIGETMLGAGPFVGTDLSRSLMRAQTFVSIVGVVGIILSVLIEQTRRMGNALRLADDVLEAGKAGEKLLQESEERYRKVVELSPDGIFIIDAASQTYVFVNPAGLLLCGATTADQVLGKSMFEFFPPSFHRYLRDRTQWLRQGQAVPPCEEKFIRLDGTVVEVEAHAAHLVLDSRLATLAILRDITQRKTAEHSLRLAAQVFENSHEGILITDRDRKIISVNRAFGEITGYEPEQVIGKLLSHLRPDSHDQLFYERIWSSIAATDRWQGELVSQRRNGQTFPAWGAVAAVRDSRGAVSNYLAVFDDISERKAAESRIQFMAEHDSLTGLPTRALLFDRLEKAIAAARRSRKRLAILFIDLNCFKQVNDTLGHQAGDKLLQAVAERLQSVVRSVDTVSRLGGDEFVIMLVDIGTAAQLAHIAENVVAAIAIPYEIDGKKLKITSSVGISTYPNDTENIDTLLKYADVAMYSAKASGCNSYRFFNREMQARIDERLALESSLRRAIEQQEFILEYQPEIEISSGRVKGVEALVRWRHPEQGLLLPGSFIGVSEDCGLIIAIGDWVLRTACKQAKAWFDADRPIVVSVNLSVAQFHQKSLLWSIGDALRSANLEPRYLELEITENILIDDADTTLEPLQALRGMGVKLAVDDFGTGYSSLSYLKRFKVDKLKIDQSFVHDIGIGRDDATIIDAIVAMAKKLDLTIVAEGVETEAQLAFLKTLDCDQYQGFYSSKSLSPEDFADFEERQRDAAAGHAASLR
ncbi:MAG: EAL domain-containing protein [Pseudomonadota bacterium]